MTSALAVGIQPIESGGHPVTDIIHREREIGSTECLTILGAARVIVADLHCFVK